MNEGATSAIESTTAPTAESTTTNSPELSREQLHKVAEIAADAGVQATGHTALVIGGGAGFVAGGIAGTIAGYHTTSALNTQTQSLLQKIEACYEKMQSLNPINNGTSLPLIDPVIPAPPPPLPLTLETFCASLSEDLVKNISQECDTLNGLLTQQTPYTTTNLFTIRNTSIAIQDTLGDHLPKEFSSLCNAFLKQATQSCVEATCSDFTLATLQHCSDFVSNALGTASESLVVSTIETIKMITPNSLDNLALIKNNCTQLIAQNVSGAETFCSEVNQAAIQQFATLTCTQEGLSEAAIEACKGLVSAAVSTLPSPADTLQNINATIALFQQETMALADVEIVAQNCQYVYNNITQPDVLEHCLTLMQEGAKKTAYSEHLLSYLNSGWTLAYGLGASGLAFAYDYGAVPIATGAATGVQYGFKAAAFLVYLTEQGLDVAKNCVDSAAIEKAGQSAAQVIVENSTEVALGLTALAAVEYKFQPIQKTATYLFDLTKRGTQKTVDLAHRTLEHFVSDDAREASKARLG